MLKYLKKNIKSLAPQLIINLLTRKRQKKEYQIWLKDSSQISTPHILKQNIISEYQNKYNIKILIETGTYLGDMIEAQKNNFKKIISIELSIELFKNALKRFQNNTNITIVQGDSGKILSNILVDIEEPTIFWLDGHYSSGITAKGVKDCPIFEELDAIFNNKKQNHIILIDDARCFNGQGDYPTIEELVKYIKNKQNEFQFEVKDDVIRFLL